MPNARPMFPILLIAALAGCARTQETMQRFTEPPPNTVNLARVRGTRLVVPAATAEFPPIALVDGITTTDRWADGAGWELHFEDALARNRTFQPDTETASKEPLEWEGLRRDFRGGKEHGALGWALFEFPGTRVVSGVTLHSVDTTEFPAYKFGVRDVLIHYWDEATQRWLPVIVAEGTRLKNSTVVENRLPKLSVPFYPVRTDLIRIAIQWTNEAEQTRSISVMGRREEYARGIIRLTEVEVYGIPEEGDRIAEGAGQMLPGEAPADPTDAPLAPPEAAIQTVGQYAAGFMNHDVDALMETIAPTYDSEGENADELRQRMTSTFREFPDFLYQLRDPRIDKVDERGVTVSATYMLHLNPLMPRVAQGPMRFDLIRIDNTWKIQRMSAGREGGR